MKKGLILLALVVQSAMVYSQINISGKVTDGKTGEAIPGVNVYVPDLNQGVATDNRGEYNLRLNTEQPIRMVFSFVGYQKSEQEVEKSSTLNVQLEPSIRLEEIIIRSVRADENIPVTQSTLTKRQIREIYNGQDPQFFLERLTPSITVESESGTHNNNYGKMRIRGMDQKRMNITLNGIPLNDMIDHGVYFSNFADFGNSIETIQVQRGVGTSTNGTSSYAGSINFESINLQHQEAGSEFQLGAGSFNSYRASVEHHTGMLENNSAFYGRFSRIWSDGYRYNVSTNAYSFFLSGGFFLNKDLIKINAFTGRTKNGLGYTAVPISLIRLDPRTNLVSKNDREDFGQHFVQVQHLRTLSPSLSLVSSAYYGGAEGDYPWGDYSDPVYIPELWAKDSLKYFQINYPLTNNHYGLMSNLHYVSPANLKLDAGIHAYTFRRQNLEHFIPDFADPYYHERSHKEELAAFAKAEYDINGFLLYGDLQMRTQVLTISPDYVFMDTTHLGNIKHSWTFLNPKVGISYQLNRNQNFYLAYGRSGREPAKRDIVGGFTLTKSALARTMEKDHVKPEFVNDFEAGFRMNYPILKGQVNFFFMDFRNELAPTGRQASFGSSIRENMARSSRKGVETDFILDFSRVYFSGTLAYMESRINEITTGEAVLDKLQSPLTPNWNVNSMVGFKPFRNLDIQLSGRYLGDYYTELTNRPEFMVPSYFIMNSRLIYNINHRFLFNLEVNNLLDKQYFNFGVPARYQGNPEPAYLVSAGRNIYLTFTSRF
jgi:iron complex outermembrane recepter protein